MQSQHLKKALLASAIVVFTLQLPLKAQLIPDRSLGGEPSRVISGQTVDGLPSSLILGGVDRNSTSSIASKRSMLV